MGRIIKSTVTTGWANGNHIDYLELPPEWDIWTEDMRTSYLDEYAQDCLHENCQGYAEVVEEED